MSAGGVLLAFMLAGCGEDDTQLDVASFEDCVASAGTPLEVGDSLDLIAEGAGVGAVQLVSDNQEIQVVAERTPDDAGGSVTQYEIFGLAQVEQIGTVVLAANNTMTDEEREQITGCLDDQGVG